MEASQVEAALDDCLLSEEEMAKAAPWRWSVEMGDPFGLGPEEEGEDDAATDESDDEDDSEHE